MTVVRRTPYRNTVQNSQLRRKVTTLGVKLSTLGAYAPRGGLCQKHVEISGRCFVSRKKSNFVENKEAQEVLSTPSGIIS
jgi:hypothetical protein